MKKHEHFNFQAIFSENLKPSDKKGLQKMNGYLVLKIWAWVFSLALSQLLCGLKQGLLAAMSVKAYKLTFEHSSEKEFKAP